MERQSTARTQFQRLMKYFQYDVSIPLKTFYDLVEDMRARLGNKVLRCVGYGHVGDSNLHLVSNFFLNTY